MTQTTIIVTSTYIQRDGKFLIAKRADDDDFMPGVWEIPGGKAEFNEVLTDAAAREIKEEMGLDIVATYVLTFRNYPHESNPDRRYIELFFLGKMKDENQEVTLSHEHSEYAWITFDETTNYDISPYTLGVLDEIRTHPLIR